MGMGGGWESGQRMREDDKRVQETLECMMDTSIMYACLVCCGKAPLVGAAETIDIYHLTVWRLQVQDRIGMTGSF